VGQGYPDIIASMAKVLISLDDQLLERIDREAAARRVSRSALLAELAAKGLGEPIGSASASRSARGAGRPSGALP
jgi:hypothetical protein